MMREHCVWRGETRDLRLDTRLPYGISRLLRLQFSDLLTDKFRCKS